MGMMDWVNDDKDGDGDTADGGDDMDDFDDMDDDFADDFADDLTADEGDSTGDGGSDDGFGGEFDDDFGEEFDDDFDDDFGGGGGGGGTGGAANANVSEKLGDFEDRIGELETELGGLSSTMNTVREENKQIGETVDELDDTIRKLLDIYEMVTRGINPFVDDAKEMGGLEHGDGAFGLFDSEEEDDEDLDSDVVNADAESFFDEDFGELDAEEGETKAEEAAEVELAEEEAVQPELVDERASPTDVDEDTESSSGGGVSFDDLKAEYDESEGWEEGDLSDDDESSEMDGVDDLAGAGESVATDEIDDLADADEDDFLEDAVEEPDDAAELDDSAEDDSGGVDDGEGVEDVDVELSEDEATTDELLAESVDTDEATDTAAGPSDADEVGTDAREPEPSAPSHPPHGEASAEPVEALTDDEMFLEETTSEQPSPSDAEGDHEPAVGRAQRVAEPAGRSDVYLSALPATYVAESVAMEWMRFLVSVGGPLGAVRALRLYEDFGWISPGVRETLDTYLRSVASPRDDEQNGSLSADHHETSLSYVSRLGDRTPEASTLDALVADGGSTHGIRR